MPIYYGKEMNLDELAHVVGLNSIILTPQPIRILKFSFISIMGMKWVAQIYQGDCWHQRGMF